MQVASAPAPGQVSERVRLESLSGINEVAAHVGMSVQNVRRLLMLGKFPKAYRVGDSLRWKLSEVDAHFCGEHCHE